MPKTWRTPSTSRAEATASPPVISMVVVLQSELDRHLECVVGPVVGDAEGLVDFLDRQHVAEERRHVDRAAGDQPHGVPERLEPWLALGAEVRVGGQPAAEEVTERERVVAGAFWQAEPDEGRPRRGYLQAQREGLPAADRLHDHVGPAP